jgi:sugar O-acyltransferase (sialic acid O-acetyltransferase NeuD family)
MAKVVIFGLQDYAELAHYYLTHDSDHEVVGFTAHREYLSHAEKFLGLPVCEFETIGMMFPSDQFSLFAPMAPTRVNGLRKSVYEEGLGKGYSFISYVSSKATMFDNEVGDNCFVLEDNTLQPFTSIGNNVVLWSGNHIGHHGRILDHVTVTSHVVISGHCTIEERVFIGVNATLRDGITVGEGALIGMGGVVTKDVEPWSVYQGNPARKSDKRSDEVGL